MYRLFVLGIVCLAFNPLYAGKGPIHKSLRAYGMGNAFVAVAEDKEAVYYNPAGLNLINRLGNYEKNPELGYYPHNFIDMRINVGVAAPLSEALDVYNLGKDIQELYNKANNDGGSGSLLDTLGNHTDLADSLQKFDLRPINIASKLDMELAVPHFGGAIWVDAGISPYLETGIITPSAGIDTVYVDAVAQCGIGFGIGERWSFGLGYKAAKREYLNDLSISLLEFDETKDTLTTEIERIRDNASKFSTVGHAIEAGMLYQWRRDLRVGASLRNLFVKKLGDEDITPNVTMGIAYSPHRLQRNTGFFRKVNLAMDFEDMLNNDRNYKFFSHLNIGMEIEQVLLAVPNWPAVRFLKLRGSAGFKGGYPTAGVALEALRFFEVEFATWAEEAGYYTGAEENRFWVFQVGIGI